MNVFSFDIKIFFTPDNNYFPVYSWMRNGTLTKGEMKKRTVSH